MENRNIEYKIIQVPFSWFDEKKAGTSLEKSQASDSQANSVDLSKDVLFGHICLDIPTYNEIMQPFLKRMDSCNHSLFKDAQSMFSKHDHYMTSTGFNTFASKYLSHMEKLGGNPNIYEEWPDFGKNIQAIDNISYELEFLHVDESDDDKPVTMYLGKYFYVFVEVEEAGI